MKQQQEDTIIKVIQLYFLLKGGLIIVGILLYLINIPIPTFISFLFESYQLYRVSVLIPVVLAIGCFYCAYGIENRIENARILAIILTIPTIFVFPIGTIIGIIIIGYLISPKASKSFDRIKGKAPFYAMGSIIMIIGILGVFYSIGFTENLGFMQHFNSFFNKTGALSVLTETGELDDSEYYDIMVVLSNHVGKSMFSQQSVNIQQEIMSEKISILGGEINGNIDYVINALRVNIKNDKIDDLLADSNVERIEKIEKVVWINEQNINYTLMLDKSYNLIEADKLWSKGITGKGIVVAVVDTGINSQIPQLQRDGRNVVVDSFEIYGDYVHWHGTACASCIASQDEIYRGISPGVDLIDVEVFQPDGAATNWDILQGWNWVAKWKNTNNQFVICSNSFGGGGIEPSLDEAANNMVNIYNIPMIIAAGNVRSGYDVINCPGTAKNVLTVGAVDDYLEIATFSCHGPTPNGLDKPDVCAPGVNINMFSDTGSLITKSGTSFSTPITAGAAALLAERHEMYSAEQIQEALKMGASDRGAIGYDYYYGYGVIQMENSLNWLNNETPSGTYLYLYLSLPFLGVGIIFYPNFKKKTS